MQILASLTTLALASATAIACVAASARVTQDAVAGAIVTSPSGKISVCLETVDAECFPVRALNDSTAVQQLALASEAGPIVPPALFLCFDETLQVCAVADMTKRASHVSIQKEATRDGATIQSIGCIFVPWGMLCNGMN